MYWKYRDNSPSFADENWLQENNSCLKNWQSFRSRNSLHFFWKWTFTITFTNRLSAVSMLNQANPVHALPLHFCKIHQVLHFSGLQKFQLYCNKITWIQDLNINSVWNSQHKSVKHTDDIYRFLRHSAIILMNNTRPATQKKVHNAENLNMEYELMQWVC
jgi:hypothetical protein